MTFPSNGSNIIIDTPPGCSGYYILAKGGLFMLEHVYDSNFESVVLNSKKPAIVDFWAQWCGPCKMLAPIINKVAQDLDGNVNVFKLDVDENPITANTYGISSIPTLVLFNEGKPVGKIVGFRPAEQIESIIKGALNI